MLRFFGLALNEGTFLMEFFELGAKVF